MPNLMAHSVCRLAWIATWVWLFTGCSRGPAYPLSTVTGRVTITGQAVPKGYITFSPLESGPVTAGEIVDGSFCVANMPSGKHRVTFQAQGAQPTTILSPTDNTRHEVPTDILPEAYRSGIEVEIGRGRVVRDFAL